MSWGEREYEDDLDPAYEDDSILRAVEKLRDLRSGRARSRPTGWFLTPLVLTIVFALLPGLACVYFAWSMRHEAPAVYVLGLVFGVPLLLAAACLIPGCRPKTPRRALTLFYKSLGRGQWKAAWGLIVPNDGDVFPRFHPEEIDRGTFEPYVFTGKDGLGAYWRPLLRRRSWPYCIARVDRLQVRQAAPDVVVASFRVKFWMNTRFWWLLIPVSLFLAAIIDVVTRTTESHDVTKILVCAGDEWHLFNGAWQGYEEEFNDWIEAESA